MTSECESNLDVVPVVGGHHFGMRRVSGRICRELKVQLLLVVFHAFFGEVFEGRHRS